MKMSRFEKMFVNSPAHSGKVSLQAVRLAGLDRFFAERPLRVIRPGTYGLSYEAILHRQ